MNFNYNGARFWAPFSKWYLQPLNDMCTKPIAKLYPAERMDELFEKALNAPQSSGNKLPLLWVFAAGALLAVLKKPNRRCR